MANATARHRPQMQPVTRDVEAIQVPYGTTVTLREGTPVSIVQVLGGMFTVRTDEGFLVRVDGKHADALGEEVPDEVKQRPVIPEGGKLTENTIWEQLKSCYDPEIPVNIVDLGLVYTCRMLSRDGDEIRVEIEMTLTAPGCGMGQVIADDVQMKVLGLPGVAEAQVDLVFDPPWDPSMMSEAARLQLGMM